MYKTQKFGNERLTDDEDGSVPATPCGGGSVAVVPVDITNSVVCHVTPRMCVRMELMMRLEVVCLYMCLYAEIFCVKARKCDRRKGRANGVKVENEN